MNKIELHTEVSQARWLESDGVWQLTLTRLATNAGDLSDADKKSKIQKNGEGSIYLGQETIHTNVLVSCVGGLVEPKSWPSNVPGRQDGAGTARVGP